MPIDYKGLIGVIVLLAYKIHKKEVLINAMWVWFSFKLGDELGIKHVCLFRKYFVLHNLKPCVAA